jgi:hypothetical protein
VRFKHRSSLFRIFEKVKFLTNGRSNLVTYIPREFQERFQALNEILKNLRREGEGWRTRVKMGLVDLTVSKKTKQMGAAYQEVDMSDMSQLPPVCLNRPQTQVTNSPPPGRPGHGEEEEMRKRRRSGGSPSEVTTNNTNTRNVNEDSVKEAGHGEEEEMRKRRRSGGSPSEVTTNNTNTRNVNEDSVKEADHGKGGSVNTRKSKKSLY